VSVTPAKTHPAPTNAERPITGRRVAGRRGGGGGLLPRPADSHPQVAGPETDQTTKPVGLLLLEDDTTRVVDFLLLADLVLDANLAEREDHVASAVHSREARRVEKGEGFEPFADSESG
jgi:hypothetical protein